MPNVVASAAAKPGGYRRPVRHVIHTVGPVWRDGSHGEAELLASRYRRSREVAAQHGVRSIAFAAISTGVYGYLLASAARIAVDTVRRSELVWIGCASSALTRPPGPSYAELLAA